MSSSLENYSISEDAMNLKDALDSILEVLVSVYESYGVPLPSRRYWTTGEPVIDCDQAVISLTQIYLGPPGDEAARPQPCSALRSMVVEISIAREIAASKSTKPPTAEQIQDAAGWQAVDAWVLMESMDQFDTWGGLGVRGPGVIATVNTPTPQGGYAQAVLNLTVAVP